VCGDLWGCYVCCCGYHGVVPVPWAEDLELLGCFFVVLVGIVIPLFFLRANFSFLGIYRRILGHICNEIWVMGHDNGFRS
jgi:hypothetical protein